jgi:hypothetical protein
MMLEIMLQCVLLIFNSHYFHLISYYQDTLSLTQIVKVANMFSVTIPDLTLPVNLHISSVRVLLTIVERLHLMEVSPVPLRSYP